MPARAALRAVKNELAAAGCPDAGYDARALFQLAAGQDPLLFDGALTPAAAEKLAGLMARRAAREPLQYILGQWDFLDFTLRVGPGVLCPRPDTEIVCEAAAACLQGCAAPRVLDLCAGTGCLGLGVKRLCPSARVTCVEKDGAAYRYLAANAEAALAKWGVPPPAVTPVQADVFTYWQTLPPESLALITANPPYLNAAEMAERMPETAREPALALDGGADGLDFYRLLVRAYRASLRPGGALVLEIGFAQAAAVTALARAAGWRTITCKKDYGGNDRALVLQN